MFENLMQLIQQSGQESVVNNPAVPNEHNEGIMTEANTAITNGLQEFAASGELEKLNASVQNGQPMDNQSPMVQQISGNFTDNIMKKFGLDSGIAKMIAAALIPMILGKIMSGSNKKQGNATGGFDLGGLLSSLTGGGNANSSTGGGGLMDKISGIGAKFGLDKDGDGDVDMDDLKKML